MQLKKASMEHHRKKITIILITLLLHGAILTFLLIFYSSPEHEWVYFDTSTAIQTPETIFSESLQQLPKPQQIIPYTPEQEVWAELKPRASTFGASMDMPEDDIGIESEESSNDTLSDEEEKQILRQASADAKAMADRQDELKENYIHADPSASSAVNAPPASRSFIEGRVEASSKQKTSVKKLQAQKALASMTRGYLEQLKQEGENLIKTIGCDPNKMPSAEQLKYERYLAKIQWCLQNAHNINRDKCQMHGPIEATMRVYFTLDRKGKMADLKIMQSSGDPFVDRYIQSLFEQASSSFPPVPAYIKEDPYQLLYTVMVCWNVASPTYMGFMRE